ncbi:MAG: amidophosphoribosyltransferase [Candidatus Daviesbacteria bacterium]|nr:amidophosphoribosyltransferase [Candidatus Daviesbacteria bacterium]
MREKCAVFGVYGKGLDAARITYFGLFALQHRGQESTGIAAADGKKIRVNKAMGLVPQVHKEKHIKKLLGYLSIGHNRYSTSESSSPKHAQPILGKDNLVALAHNGNLPSVEKLKTFLSSVGVKTTGLNDSELMHAVINYYLEKGKRLEVAIELAFPLFTGVFCLIILTKNKIAAVRDKYGVRPLSIGKLNGGYVISSETCGLDSVGAKFLRDVKPGEMVVVDKKGLSSYQLGKGETKLDIFEFVYFARLDSVLLGKSVYQVRKNFGKQLALERVIKADIVVPIPESAIPVALGYAEAAKISFEYGLSKNRYIGRTFIMPEQHLRDRFVELKLSPVPGVLKGKKVVLVDDSIVRGTTIKKIVKLVKGAGASEVHVIVSCPPLKYPDFYGIDTPSQSELIGAKMSVLQIQKFIGADSLHFLSYEGMIKATGLPEEYFCTSCFTGIYPVDIAERAKNVFDPIFTAP